MTMSLEELRAMASVLEEAYTEGNRQNIMDRQQALLRDISRGPHGSHPFLDRPTETHSLGEVGEEVSTPVGVEISRDNLQRDGTFQNAWYYEGSDKPKAKKPKITKYEEDNWV